MERGKRICQTLKELRKRIADANSIPYEIEDCSHEGPCPGTCPRCEAEVRYLEKALDEKRERGEDVTINGLMTEEELTLLPNNQNDIETFNKPSCLTGEPTVPPEDILRERLEREILFTVWNCMSLADRYPSVGLFISETDHDVLCVREPAQEGEALLNYRIYDWRELMEEGQPSQTAISLLAKKLIPVEIMSQCHVEETQDGPIYGQETAWPEEPFEGKETDLLEDPVEGYVIMHTPEPTKIKQMLTSITVAGTSHVKFINILAEDIHKGVELSLYRDVNNKYDPNAIALYFGDHRIGYVPKEKNEILANLLAADIPLIAIVTDTQWRGNWLEIKAHIALTD